MIQVVCLFAGIRIICVWFMFVYQKEDCNSSKSFLGEHNSVGVAVGLFITAQNVMYEGV